MTPQEIRDTIAAETDPTFVQARTLGQTEVMAAWLSRTARKVGTRMVSARGLAEHMPGGPLAAEAILLKLEGARDEMLASADAQTKVMGSLLRRQLGFLGSDGLDFGSAALRGMLDQFALLGILTQQEVDGLKSIGLVPDPVTGLEVSQALEG